MTPPRALRAGRADEAARTVVTVFGTRVLRCPGTHLGQQWPGGDPPGLLHYWWQAHYADAMLDAALRSSRAGDRADARRWAGLASRLVHTVWARNGFRIVNDYYDDMAWMGLTMQRLETVRRHLGLPTLPSVGRWQRRLLSELRQGTSAEGGTAWHRHTDFRNTAATAPAALACARAGDPEQARRMLGWLMSDLRQPTGLLADGVSPDKGLEGGTYTYNQGPVLALMLQLADDLPPAERLRTMSSAAQTVHAVASELTLPGAPGVLLTHGGGDGGLFTGVLTRYLTVAALDTGLAQPARSLAREMVLATADALWAGSSVTDVVGRSARMFSADPSRPYDAPDAELSVQVQAWTVLEAAAVLSHT